MDTFGDTEIEWRDSSGETHVLVATTGSSWAYLCSTDPRKYVTWDNDTKPPVEAPTTEAVVWKHDRKKVTCGGCQAMLDGATIEFRKAAL